ncbi:MAG: phospholipid-binding protein MlaC [Gammaproteobacteria bacterium]
MFKPTALASRLVAAFVLFVSMAFTPCVAAPDPQAARVLVEQTARRMVDALQDPAARHDADRLRGLVDAHLVPQVDFQVCSRMVLGPRWRDATQAQRDAFVYEFRELLVTFYTGVLGTFLQSREVPHDMMSFDPAVTAAGEREAVVHSQVRQPDSGSVPVDYRMLWRDGWKVVDVSVAGVSMVVSYRSEFAGTAARSGLDGLIAELQARNRRQARAP